MGGVMVKVAKTIWVVTVLMLLNACGYQLRQAAPLSDAMKQSHLQLPTDSPLYRPLAVALGHQGVTLHQEVTQAQTLIVVHENRLEKVVQSIGVNNRVQEYRLDYEVVFSVYENDELVIARQRLNISKDFSFDIEQITGSQAEERVLREQMHQDMADMIIRRLASRK